MSIFKLSEGENLVTYYMLPLVKVNKKTFGSSYKNAYIDKQGLKIYVELLRNMKSPIYKSTPQYVTEIVIKDIKFVQFVIPSQFIHDSQYFTMGKYSMMSKEAKKLIYTTSTLPYNATMGSFSVSHPVLQALDKTKTLRQFLNTTLGTELNEKAELMEAPDDSWFFEHRLKQFTL